MDVLDAFNRGFGAAGRSLLRVGRKAWKAWDHFATWVFLGWYCTAVFGLVHGVWAAVWFGSIIMSIRGYKDTRRARAMYLSAQTLSEKALAADNLRLEAEEKANQLELACAVAERTVVEIRDGRTQLGPEAIAASVGLAAEQLARIVADMRDEEFGGRVLAVANHLLELQQDLEADSTEQVETTARISDLHRRIMEQTAEALAEATQQLVETMQRTQQVAVPPKAVRVRVKSNGRP